MACGSRADARGEDAQRAIGSLKEQALWPPDRRLQRTPAPRVRACAVWLTWTAAEGTVTACSSRNVICTVTSVPGQSSSFSLGMVARTGTIPVGASTLFSIIVT